MLSPLASTMAQEAQQHRQQNQADAGQHQKQQGGSEELAGADELANAGVAARQHRGVDVDHPGLRVDGIDQSADAEPMEQPIARCCALDEAEQRLRHGRIDLGALVVVTIGVDQGLLGIAK